MASIIQNYPPVQQYLQARAQLHQEISSKDLLGPNAVQVNDQITLRRDVVVNDTTYKAGSTYSLNPYAERTHHHESLTFEKGGQRTLIQHEYTPHFFTTSESLSVETISINGMGPNGGSFSMNDISGGIRPHGWMQKVLDSEGGYVLQGYPFEKNTTAA